jgi:site-specific DNA recombinase
MALMADRRAVVYARFSSEKQSDRSIEDQVELCRTFCEREGLRVLGVYDDRAISGASTINRAGWLKLMRDSTNDEFDVVVAESLDRISRDQEDLARIYKRLRFKQIEIWTVQDGRAGEIHVGVKGLLGALYLKDLAQKTKRGQAGVIRDGRHNGGRSYGYRGVAGKAGVLEIQHDEAAIVRRIFDNYAKGWSPRDIAAELNREAIPGPRGGPWNASTIGGSRKRANGVLQNALYVGRVVWNRQSFIKDPETGRRVSRLNAQSEWMTAEVPELRIIDEKIWDKVQRRRAERSGEQHQRARPRHLFSGLLKCGCCGSGYVVAGADKRGRYLRCSRMVETGLCDNRRTISLEWVESQIVQGIEVHLAAPDLIAEYVREYRREWTKLRNSADRRRSDLSTRLARIKTETDRAVDAILENPTSRSLQERLAALERKRDEAEAAMADVELPPAIEFHPNVAESYRKKVRDLRAALAQCGEDDRADAMAAIRELVEKVAIIPAGPYGPVELKIHGRLATLLQASNEGAIKRPESMGAVVAGVGFEPTTFRL